MSKDIMKIKVSDIFEGFPDFEQQQPQQRQQQPRQRRVVHGSDKPRRLSVNETKTFHKKKHLIGRTIIQRTDSRETHYGARALNARFPSYLDRHTRDFDIFTPHPYRDARETEKALDKKFNGDFFYVTQAEHPGTWKVKAHATDETYADYTKTPKGIPRENIRGIFYPTIPHIEKSLKRTLNDPTASHRHTKDQDSFNRIQIYKMNRRMF